MKYISEQIATSLFDDYLDEINPIIRICGMEYLPSRVLHEIDRIAYSCLQDDWLDAEGLTTCEEEANTCKDCDESLDDCECTVP